MNPYPIFVLVFNNGVLVEFVQTSTNTDFCTLPIAYSKMYCAVANLKDTSGNYSCRIHPNSTLTELRVTRGGSVNPYYAICIGY